MWQKLRLLPRAQALVFALAWPFLISWSVKIEGIRPLGKLAIFGPIPASQFWILWLVLAVPPAVFLLVWAAARTRWRH